MVCFADVILHGRPLLSHGMFRRCDPPLEASTLYFPPFGGLFLLMLSSAALNPYEPWVVRAAQGEAHCGPLGTASPE